MSNPASHADLVDAIADARREGNKLELRGGGSKSLIGAPRDVRVLSLTAFSGIVDYDPAELVLTCGAATPLGQLQELVGARDQMLAFEPFDHGPMLGAPSGRATIGGIIAAGIAGPQRLSQGGARDHLLGFEAVSGRGERFRAGAKVVKNVTGYDLPKLLAGSWGRLAALTEVTLKVMPRPQTIRTVVLPGLSPRAAIVAMSEAMRSQAEVAAAAHLPGDSPAEAMTLLRVQGFGPSVDARVRMLGADADGAADELWQSVRDASSLQSAPTLWRVVLPAARACECVAALEPYGARWLFDWAGGLVWIGIDAHAERVPEVAAECGGHATLIRASAALRQRVATFPAQSAAVAALSDGVRRAFDPDGIFATARFAVQVA